MDEHHHLPRLLIAVEEFFCHRPERLDYIHILVVGNIHLDSCQRLVVGIHHREFRAGVCVAFRVDREFLIVKPRFTIGSGEQSPPLSVADGSVWLRVCQRRALRRIAHA